MGISATIIGNDIVIKNYYEHESQKKQAFVEKFINLELSNIRVNQKL